MTASHYSGGVTYVSRNTYHESLPGWPACGAGRLAYLSRGVHAAASDFIDEVTCKRCIREYAKHVAHEALRAAREPKGTR